MSRPRRTITDEERLLARKYCRKWQLTDSKLRLEFKGGRTVLYLYATDENDIDYKIREGSWRKMIKPHGRTAIDKASITLAKFREVHGVRYEYPNIPQRVKYRDKISVLCSKHGEFIVEVGNHARGSGCPKCAEETRQNNGWNLNGWISTAKKSSLFDSFKVYIIKLYDGNEEFYKIGRTFSTVKRRFFDNSLPYNYEIVKVIKGDAKYIYELELELKRKFKDFKYEPSNKFGGHTECFLINKDLLCQELKEL